VLAGVGVEVEERAAARDGLGDVGGVGQAQRRAHVIPARLERHDARAARQAQRAAIPAVRELLDPRHDARAEPAQDAVGGVRRARLEVEDDERGGGLRGARRALA
jgi:hypothetical protein